MSGGRRTAGRDLLRPTETEVVRKGITASKSLQEIQAQGVSDEWKPWGTGFINTERFTGFLIRDVQAEN